VWGFKDVIACQTIAALGRLMLTAGDPAPLAAHLSQHWASKPPYGNAHPHCFPAQDARALPTALCPTAFAQFPELAMLDLSLPF